MTDYKKPPNPSGDQNKYVWAPKTRLAVGVVFIGALVYSMVPLIFKPLFVAVY